MIGDYERPAMSIFDIVLAKKHKNKSIAEKNYCFKSTLRESKNQGPRKKTMISDN